MISTKNLTIKPHKANAIDKRAIANLRPHLQWEIECNHLPITHNDLCDESNYVIIEVEGYENIAFNYKTFISNEILETIQPIDRANNKLFPIQKIEIQVHYKRY